MVISKLIFPRTTMMVVLLSSCLALPIDQSPNDLIVDLSENIKDSTDASNFLKRMAESFAETTNATMSPYKFSYKTDNIEQEQIGMIVDGKPVVMGSYSVSTPDGATIMTVYTADKNGYKPIVMVRYVNKNRKNLLKSLVG